MPNQSSLLAGLLVPVLLAAVTCGPQAADDEDPQSYTVRGTVVRVLESPGGTELFIAHEAIPEFVGRSGEVEGMMPMTMSFPVADGVDLSEIEWGTPVEFTFVVDWDGVRPIELVAIQPVD